jgi:hypothetical protein
MSSRQPGQSSRDLISKTKLKKKKRAGDRAQVVGSEDGVCDQETFKFFVSLGEEFMAGHVGINGVY